MGKEDFNCIIFFQILLVIAMIILVIADIPRQERIQNAHVEVLEQNTKDGDFHVQLKNVSKHNLQNIELTCAGKTETGKSMSGTATMYVKLPHNTYKDVAVRTLMDNNKSLIPIEQLHSVTCEIRDLTVLE